MFLGQIRRQFSRLLTRLRQHLRDHLTMAVFRVLRNVPYDVLQHCFLNQRVGFVSQPSITCSPFSHHSGDLCCLLFPLLPFDTDLLTLQVLYGCICLVIQFLDPLMILGKFYCFGAPCFSPFCMIRIFLFQLYFLAQLVSRIGTMTLDLSLVLTNFADRVTLIKAQSRSHTRNALVCLILPFGFY